MLLGHPSGFVIASFVLIPVSRVYQGAQTNMRISLHASACAIPILRSPSSTGNVTIRICNLNIHLGSGLSAEPGIDNTLARYYEHASVLAFKRSEYI